MTAGERPAVRRLPDGRLRVGGRLFDTPVLVLAGAVRAWPPGADDWLRAERLAPVLGGDADLDLLLVGTGCRRRRLPAATVALLDAAGIAHEAMATASAVRALNALAGDARRIGLAAHPG